MANETKLAQVQGQVQEYWSPRFTTELRESLLMGSLVDKKYDGEIRKGGDKVTVSQIVAPDGQLLDAQTDDSFDSDLLTTKNIVITADKRAVASYKFHDIVEIQSLIERDNPEVMASLRYSMEKQINDYLYTLVSPSASAPDHTITGVTDFNASQLGAVRVLAAEAKWMREQGWYGLLSPQYYQDLLNATTIASIDYGASDAPTIGGQLALKRFGFNILEDNSRSGDYGLFFHPDFLHLVMQTAVQVKISDLHPRGQFGFLMSVDVIFGAKVGIDGSVKHITVTA